MSVVPKKSRYSTYIIPIRATHLQRAVSFRREHAEIPVAEDVGESEATFPDAAPTSGIEMQIVPLSEIVPRTKQDYTAQCSRTLTKESYELQVSGGGVEGFTYKRKVCSVVLSMVISAAQLSCFE